MRLVPLCLAALLTTASFAQAQTSPTTTPSWHSSSLLQAVFACVVFGLTGIVLAIAGFKLFDLVTPFSLEEMCENKNVAVGILCGAIVLGICHIIAAAMS